MRPRLPLCLATLATLAACSDSSGPRETPLGPPASVVVQTGDNQVALAGTAIALPVQAIARDASGRPVPGQPVTFSVAFGGGSIAASTATTDANGAVALPGWTLGKSAVPQQVRVTVGTSSVAVNASVQSAYPIDVRFFGPTMTGAQRLLFTNAAARIRAAVVSPLGNTLLAGADPKLCGADSTIAVLGPETTTGVLIYASVQNIDGPRKILAQAGPCYLRDASSLTVIGIMSFDAADIDSLGSGQVLQDVITHEMLHVLGLGTFWNERALLSGYNTPSVAYVGPAGIAGCQAIGGVSSCASAVPVENTGGPGTANSHWRESVFGPELMTGFASNGPMPLSLMTVRALADLGYDVNPSAADPYSITVGSLRSSAPAPAAVLQSPAWEQALPFAPRRLPTTGASFTRGHR